MLTLLETRAADEEKFMVLTNTVVRFALLVALAGGLAAGCSAGSSTASGAPTGTAAGNGAAGTAPSAAPAAANSACSGGLTGQEPGVVRITCSGTATVHIQVGDVARDLRGGVCQSTADVWSVAVGVIIDTTGTHGKYTGPVVDNVTVNDTSTPGRGTIQSSLGGKLYFDLGNATMTIAPDRKSAHLEGTSEQASDAPKAKITVSVTC